MANLPRYAIFAGFLLAAYVAVLDSREVEWSYFVPAIALGIVGVVVFRRARSADAKSDDRVRSNLELMGQALERIHAQLHELAGGELPPHQYRFEIDRRFRGDLMDFAEARESMIHHFGLQGYAQVMSSFAAGERYINRVWSASTDGYVDEVRTYLGKAERQFAEARDQFTQHRSNAS